MSDNDLSEYEKLRLENINRNLEFLKSLGIATKENLNQSAREEPKPKTPKRKATPTKVKEEPNAKYLRRSPRLLASEGNTPVKEEPGNEEDQQDVILGYESMPLESNELDDFEFQLFVKLRAWRLKRCRELDIEPYKIFNNRTIAEFIRRKRNDSQWLLSTSPEKQLTEELLMCWGIGPSKAKVDGFGFEMMNYLLHSEELQSWTDNLFEQSRTLCPLTAAKEEDTKEDEISDKNESE